MAGRPAVWMDAGEVLDVAPVADDNPVDIGAQYGAIPHGAVVAHADVAHYGRVFSEVAVISPVRSFAVYGLNDGFRHASFLLILL